MLKRKTASGTSLKINTYPVSSAVCNLLSLRNLTKFVWQLIACFIEEIRLAWVILKALFLQFQNLRDVN